MVAGYPVDVIVSRDADAVLGGWSTQAAGAALRTLALAALAALLLTMIARQLRRLDAARDRFALAVAGSDDGIWDWDFAREQAFESARARELQGLPPGPELQPLPALLASLRMHPGLAPRRGRAGHGADSRQLCTRLLEPAAQGPAHPDQRPVDRRQCPRARRRAADAGHALRPCRWAALRPAVGRLPALSCAKSKNSRQRVFCPHRHSGRSAAARVERHG